MTPSYLFLKQVSAALKEAGIVHAVGGSGLLYTYGVWERVNDWDITTEASLKAVTYALSRHRIAFADRDGGFPFASAFCLAIVGEGEKIDLIGRFAIHTKIGVCRIPTFPCRVWNGVPVGSAEVWAVAYALMGRGEKADSLFRYVEGNGANPQIVASLLQQPLPPQVRRRVERWQASGTRKG